MNVSLDITDNIAVVTMDDGKMNAITADAIPRLLAALDEAEEDAAALVLAGRPGSFSAGFDRKTMLGGDTQAIATLALGGAEVSLKLAAFPKPVVAACTGHAFTIGTLWLLACDTRIAESGDFKFGMTETALGKILPAWSMALLRYGLAPKVLTAAVVQAQLFDCQGALAGGVIDELTSQGTVLETAMQRAQMLSELPADAYAGNKLALRELLLRQMKADIDGLSTTR